LVIVLITLFLTDIYLAGKWWKKKQLAWQSLGKIQLINQNPHFQFQFPQGKEKALKHFQEAFWRMLAAKMNLSWSQFLEQLKKRQNPFSFLNFFPARFSSWGWLFPSAA